MDLKQLESQLVSTFEDMRLSKAESYDLKEISSNVSAEQCRFLKNKSFDLARDAIQADLASSPVVLSWLEKTIKALDHGLLQNERSHSVHFSPGTDCRIKLLELMSNAKSEISICVFTISDNQLSDEILSAHQRGIKVRVITDDDKSGDRGSDIDYLIGKGVDIRMDDSPSHMHHKFMVVDKSFLANGSFNWTNSATKYNQENILVTDEPQLVLDFQHKFEQIWQMFE